MTLALRAPRTAKTRTTRPARTETAMAVALAGVAAIWLLARHYVGVPTDYLVYRSAARAAAHGADIYVDHGSTALFATQPFTYTPFGSVALWPTTLGGWHPSYLLWCAVAMLTLGAVLTHFVPTEVRSRSVVVAVSFTAAATTCVMSENIKQGQINIVLMGLVLADLFRRDDTLFGRVLPRGVLVGVATAIKLTPGLFIVFFLLTRQWRLARCSAAGAAVATACATLLHPELTRSFFRSVLWSLSDRVNLSHPTGYWGNSSIQGAVAAAGGWAQAATLPLVLGFGGYGLFAAGRAWGAGRQADGWLTVGLTAPVVSPFTWTHHYVYLLPALATLALTRSWARSRVGLGVGLVVLVALHFGPRLGETWLAGSSSWLWVPGVLMRESLVFISVGCIAALHLTAGDQGVTRANPDATAHVASVR